MSVQNLFATLANFVTAVMGTYVALAGWRRVVAYVSVSLSFRAINRSAWREAEGRQARERVSCVARPPCVNTAGEARQRRVYNTKGVCYTC